MAASSTKPSGKVIAVTGASRGIGAVIALELHGRGHVVGCLTRSGKGPSATGRDAGSSGRFINVACDVTREDSVKEALARLADTAGALDRKSTRLNSSHWITSRMPSSA